jgi:hypothetical protein
MHKCSLGINCAVGGAARRWLSAAAHYHND